MKERHQHFGRRLRAAVGTAVVVVLTIAVGLAVAPTEPVAATPSDEAAFVSALNQTRADAGLPPMTVDGELTALSRGWAQAQADAGEISHANPISAGMTTNWLKLGENVGTGPSVSAIMDAFIASPSHYANIVDPEFTRVGVGVVWDGPRMYTTHRFMKVAETPPPEPAEPIESSAPTPDSSPPPAAAPTAPTTPPPELPPTVAPPSAEPERVVLVLTELRQLPL